MKRSIGLLLAFFLLALPACTAAPVPPDESYSLSYRSLTLTVGMEADALLAALGEPTRLQEAPACAGEGLDRLYIYPSLELYIFVPTKGAPILTSATYTDDADMTAHRPDGLGVGSGVQAVLDTLGEPSERSDTTLIYRRAGTVLTFSLDGGTVQRVTLQSE